MPQGAIVVKWEYLGLKDTKTQQQKGPKSWRIKPYSFWGGSRTNTHKGVAGDLPWDSVKIQGEVNHTQANRKIPTPLRPWSWISSFPNCYSRHPVCGTLLWYTEQTNIPNLEIWLGRDRRELSGKRKCSILWWDVGYVGVSTCQTCPAKICAFQHMYIFPLRKNHKYNDDDESWVQVQSGWRDGWYKKAGCW